MRYVVGIRAGENAESIPPDFFVETRPIRGDFNEPPQLPAEFAGNPNAVVVSVPELEANQDSLRSSYEQSARFQRGQVHKIREFRFRHTLTQWRKNRRAAGIVHNGAQVPITTEAMADIAALSNARASLTYPVVLFDGAVTCENANALRDLEIAMCAGLAAIETQASDFVVRADAAETVAEIESVEQDIAALS